jgi:hypothetical protein
MSGSDAQGKGFQQTYDRSRRRCTNLPTMPTERSAYDRVLRRWFSKTYIYMMITRETRQHQEKVQAAKSGKDLKKLEESHYWNMRGWEDWLNSMEDPELVTRAERMNLCLDDIPKPASDDPNRTPRLARKRAWKLYSSRRDSSCTSEGHSGANARLPQRGAGNLRILFENRSRSW